MHNFITPKSVVAATIVASLTVVSAVGMLGYQTYDRVRNQAIVEFHRANTLETTQLNNLDTVLAEAKTQIATAEALYASTEGKTLTNDEREVLAEDIRAAKGAVAAAEAEAENVAYAFATAGEEFEAQLWWPDNALALAQELRSMITSLTGNIETALKRLSSSAEKVQTAQAAWQAEQDRLAAEAAAKAAEDAQKAAEAAAKAAQDRMSKTPTIPSGSTLTPTGGATAPTTPPPPPDAAAQIAEARAETPGFDPAAYMAGFASPSQYIVQYVPNLCNGYYVCGRTLVSTNATPIIQLDSNQAVMDVYATDIGKYVLVHEVAHVRQFWSYGANVSGMIAATEPLASTSGRTGVAAVEYMADCSTIPRIGYAISPVSWPYTTSCTTAQYQAGLAIW